MIASYKHNFIFIKSKQVGGTTAEVVLSAICGPDDIITPLGSHDKITRSSEGELLPRNFCAAEDEKIWRDAMLSQDFDVINKCRESSTLFTRICLQSKSERHWIENSGSRPAKLPQFDIPTKRPFRKHFSIIGKRNTAYSKIF